MGYAPGNTLLRTTLMSVVNILLVVASMISERANQGEVIISSVVAIGGIWGLTYLMIRFFAKWGVQHRVMTGMLCANPLAHAFFHAMAATAAVQIYHH